MPVGIGLKYYEGILELTSKGTIPFATPFYPVKTSSTFVFVKYLFTNPSGKESVVTP